MISMRLIFILALSINVAGLAAETPPAEEKSHWRRWAAQLGDNDFEVREAAVAKLRQAGSDAWPTLQPLLKSSDGEVIQRVRGLAREYGILLPDQEPLVAELIKRLAESSDQNVRVATLDRLLALGKAGHVRVQKLFSGEGCKPVFKLIVQA